MADTQRAVCLVLPALLLAIKLRHFSPVVLGGHVCDCL